MKNKKLNIPFKKKMALSLFGQIKASETKLHKLRTLFWEFTLRCNQNCRHCGSDCTKDAVVQDMKLDDFIPVLKEIAAVYDPSTIMIAILGGEPLVRNDIEECGRAIRKLGFSWGTVTNGLLLTENKYRSLIRAGMGSISVSLDGLEESHNWLRGHKDSFKKSVNAIKIITDDNKIAFDVISCIHSKNFDELNDLKELLISLGVKRWRIFNIFPKGRAKNENDFDLTSSQFIKLMNFIVETKKEGRINVNYACEGFLGKYEGLARNSFFFCNSGISVASIMCDGSISGCLSCRSDFIQGSIYKDSFVDLWENGFKIMRNRSWMKNGICTDCKVFKWCKGNGLHLREKMSDELVRCHYNMINEGD